MLLKRSPILVLMLFKMFLFPHRAHAEAPGSCPTYPYLKPASGSLASVNCDFHKAYDLRAEEIMNKFGARGGRPVILNLGGTLIFKHNGQTETIDAAPDRFHLIKAFAHSVFATDLIVQHVEDGRPLPEEIKASLRTLQTHLMQATSELDTMDIQPEEEIRLKKLAEHNLQFIQELVESTVFSRQLVTLFFTEIRNELETVVKSDVVLQLSLIDNAVTHWLKDLTVEEQTKLGVAVATVHQARAQEVSLQYFAHKLGFKYGEGALHENGFVVLEGKFDEESALKLLARHYLDREAGEMMFDNPERLQQDLMGPAAQEILSETLSSH